MNNNLKRTLAAVMAVAVILCAAPLNGFLGIDLPDWLSFGKIEAHAVTEFTSGIYTYTLSGANAVITKVDSSASGSVSVPKTLDGYIVSGIGSRAFYSTAITSITLPSTLEGTASYYYDDGIESDHYGPFAGAKIKTVIFEEGTETIPSYCLSGCRSLTDVTIPDSVKTIGDKAFYKCTSLAAVNLPKELEIIGDYAFAFCGQIEKITLPDKTQEIESNAFSNCTKLKTVDLNKIKTIGSRAFYSTAITSITLPSTLEETASYYYDDGIESDHYGPFAGAKIKTVIFEEGTETIPSYCLSGCRSLTDVTIPDSVKTIGDNAFYKCTSLKTISLPKSLKTVGLNAFYGCISLSDVYYASTKADWDKIEIKEGNDSLLNAKIHFASAQTIKVKANDMTLNYKQTGKLDYAITPESDDYKVEYISSNEKIVTVDKNGNVKAAGKGTADITVKVTDSKGNEYKDTCKVTVKYTFVQWIIIILLFGWLWY